MSMPVEDSIYNECRINVPSRITSELARKSVDKLNKILDMQWMLSNIQFLEYLPSRILELISTIIDAHCCEIYLYDARKLSLQLVSARGFPGLIMQSRQGEKTIADLVFGNAGALNIPDLNEYPEMYRYPYGSAVRSVLSVPIKTPNRVMGVIQAASRDVSKFSTEDYQLMSIMVDTMAVLIQTSMMVEDVDFGIIDGSKGILDYQTFRERLEHEIERARRTRQVLALMAVSTNNHDELNNEFSYFLADYTLKKVSQAIRHNVRQYDLICRRDVRVRTPPRSSGCEETSQAFGKSLSKRGNTGASAPVQHKLLVALPQLDRLSAPLMADRLRSLIAESPLECYDQKTVVQLYPNIGIAFCPDDSDDSDTLMKLAEQALQKCHETDETVLSWGSEQDRTLPEELFRVKAHPLDVANPWDIPLKEFLWLSLTIMAETFRAERASLVTIANTNGSRKLKIEFARGVSEAVMDRTFASTVGIIGEVIQSRQPVIVEDIEKDPRFQRSNKPDYKTKSFMCIPIGDSDQVTGVVTLADKESGESFAEDELNYAASMTKQIGMVIFDKRMMYVDAIAEMLSIFQDTRLYWKGHSKRVAKYARRIADYLQLDERRAEHVERAGLLHDLGDIRLNPHIFLKRGPLSKSEKKHVDQRSLIGQRVCRSVSFLRPYEDTIFYLRKEPNVRGYSYNGDRELPDSVRILAISEAFDAMTSDRPHRSRMVPEDAINELSRSARTWFDDRIINALQSVLDEC